MIDQTINQMRSAAREAIGQYTQMAGVQRIPTRTLQDAFKNMTEDDLNLLADQFGVDQVAHLIRRAAGG